MQTVWQDLRYAARMLLKRPGFTIIAVLTLALGIGANTAIFSVVNAVLLRPLPYPEPDRLVFIYNTTKNLYSKFGLIEAEFLRLRDQARSLELVSLYTPITITLTGMGEAERISAGTASGDLFKALGAQMALGRTFKLEEEPAGRDNVVILSHDFWQRSFSADPGVLGRALTLNERSYTIVGVLPQGFKSPLELQADQPVELWLPPGYNPSNPCCSHGLSVIARLREGQTIEQARADIKAIIAGVMKEYPGGYSWDVSKRTLLEPLTSEIVGDMRHPLWVLLAAVAFVLLIACANVSNLLLARNETRASEIAIRTALGAGRARIVRQLLVESLLLAIIGGGFGLLLALWGLEVLPALGVEKIPRLREIALDRWVLGFTLVMSLLTVVIFALAPAFQAVKFDLQAALKEGRRTSAVGKSRRRLRNALVVTEVALSLVLLAGAGLLIRSFWRLQQVETGLRAEYLLTMRLFPPESAYPGDLQVAAFYENLLQRVRSLPGVTDAAAASGVPIGEGNTATETQIEGLRDPSDLVRSRIAEFRVVSPGYFRTMGIRLVRGRLLENSDQELSAPVAVINETMARAYWPNGDALGRRFRLLDKVDPKDSRTVFLTVVGIVADVKNNGLTKKVPREAYVTMRQRTVAIAAMGAARRMTLAVRTSVEPMNLAAAIRQEVSALDRNVPITEVRTMEQILARATAQPRFNTILLGIFAAVALALAGVGIYGVLSYAVTQRTHEVGIRIALGARRGDVVRLVVGQGMLLTLLGVAIGLSASFALTRLMEGLLYQVSATDPWTFALVALLLTGVALVACYIPARRAAKVDPMAALRVE
jgi:putative ABC transport system permease protein